MRRGRYVIELENTPSIIGWSAVVGKTESEGPLGKCFDMVIDDEHAGRDTWEEAESELHKTAVGLALDKTGLKAGDIDCIYSGDLINQCTGSAFGIRDYDIPYCGIYGACSTSVLSLITAAISVNSGAMRTAIASTSSHFCSAEKQFRYPLEYGGQRTPTSQRTVTGASAAIVSAKGERNCPVISKVIYGRMKDLGVTDANNMGAAMAPAAAQTIADFLCDTGTVPEDYDLILTGDLGKVGTELLYELLKKEYKFDISSRHNDTGLMMYYIEEQDVHAGGSGCGCCGTVMCSKILNEIQSGEMKKVFVVATGALLSAISPFQGETIPGIAHGALITAAPSNLI